MAIQDKQAFIKELANKPHRRRPLMRPSLRALLWFALALVGSAAWMHGVQAFRAGFADQLVHHPLFLIEIAGALLFSACGAYVLMVRSTPGARLSRGMRIGLWTLGGLYIIAFTSSLTHWAPEATIAGKRDGCWAEVVVHGAACLLLFVVMIFRGWVRFSWRLGVLYGLVAGLVPAVLMQLACLYAPTHALLFHYLPVLILVPVGLLAMRLVRK